MAIFGRVQIGSGSRFSSKGQPRENSGYQPDVTQPQLESPPPPSAYSGIKVGPEFEIEHEPLQALPIDGSYRLPRTLSPFMIQVEPPLIVSRSGIDKAGQGKNYAGVFNAAHRGAPSAWQSARESIRADIPGGSHLANAGSVEGYISQGFTTRSQGGSQTRTVDVKGDGPTRLGTPAIADVQTAVDITMQLRALVNTPPLILLINPQSLTMNYTKVQQFSDRTRYGFVFQAWGEEQPKLSINARCGAFISGGRGVQMASRRDSAAWQNLATAFQFYKNNGYIHDTVGKSNAHHMVGALSIHYDGWVYYGNMESFNYNFEETNQQGGVTFDMEFTVNAMVDTSKQSLVVTPMTGPVPSANDARYQGAQNRALAREGDISVGGPDGVRFGGSDFYSRNDYTRGTPSPAPAPATATRGAAGFRTAPTPSTASEPSVRARPFGLRR